MTIESEVNYPRLDYEWRQRHERFVRRVLTRNPRLICQECGGAGRFHDMGHYGPPEICGWCEGTGYVDAWRRGYWLRIKRNERRDVTTDALDKLT